MLRREHEEGASIEQGEKGLPPGSTKNGEHQDGGEPVVDEEEDYKIELLKDAKLKQAARDFMVLGGRMIVTTTTQHERFDSNVNALIGEKNLSPCEVVVVDGNSLKWEDDGDAKKEVAALLKTITVGGTVHFVITPVSKMTLSEQVHQILCVVDEDTETK